MRSLERATVLALLAFGFAGAGLDPVVALARAALACRVELLTLEGMVELVRVCGKSKWKGGWWYRRMK